MEITQESQGSIYVPQGELNEGRIADPLKAQEIANLEKPARDMEGAMEKQTQTGMTEEQKRNFEVMEGLKNKYPDAFTSVTDSKGRETLIANACDRGSSSDNENGHWPGSVFVFSREGLVIIDSSIYEGRSKAIIKGIDWGKFADRVAKKDDEDFDHQWRDQHNGLKRNLFDDENLFTDTPPKKINKWDSLSVQLVDLSNAVLRAEVKIVMEQAQRLGEIKKKEEEKITKISTSSILNDL